MKREPDINSRRSSAVPPKPQKSDVRKDIKEGFGGNFPINPMSTNVTTQGTKESKYFGLMLGTIIYVDIESLKCSVKYDQTPNGEIPADNIDITLPLFTGRALIGGIPQPGTRVIIGFVGFSGGNDPLPKPYILAYLPREIGKAKNFDLTDTAQGQYSNFVPNKMRLSYQKLYEGELMLASAQGSDVRVDEDIRLSSSRSNEITLRSFDQAIVQNSLQYYRQTDAGSVADGVVSRYLEMSYDKQGRLLNRQGEGYDIFGISPYEKRVVKKNGKVDFDESLITPDLRQRLIVNCDGRYQWVRTLSGIYSIDDPYLVSDPSGNLGSLSRPLVEHRREVKELGDYKLSINSDITGFGRTKYDVWNEDFNLRNGNIIESVEGTLVGYDFYNFPENYGKVLRPKIFDDDNSINLDIKEELVELGVAPNNETSERQAIFNAGLTRTRSIAKMWKMPFEYSQTRFYITKEGYLGFHIGATKFQDDFIPIISPPREDSEIGKSVDGSFAGRVRLVIDKSYAREESLDVTTIGRSFFHFGCDDGKASRYRRKTQIDGKDNPLVGTSKSLKTSIGNGSIERISIETITDGGISLRIGKSSPGVRRKFIQNGFDAKGREVDKLGNDVMKAGRSYYTDDDYTYRFHDMTFQTNDKEGRGGKLFNRIFDKLISTKKYASEGDKKADLMALLPMIKRPDDMATSLDVHSCGNIFLRSGRDGDGNSLGIDLDGGLVAAIGADTLNRSMQIQLDGGVQFHVGRFGAGHSLQGVFEGDLDMAFGGDNNVTARGNVGSTVDGSFNSKVNGKQTVDVSRDLVTSVGQDVKNSIGGISKAIVGSFKGTEILNSSLNKQAYAVTIANGNVENVVVLKGDFLNQTTTGNIENKVLLAGNIENFTLAGNIKNTTGAGNIESSTKVGKISLDTLTGPIEITSKLQEVKVECTLGDVKLKAAKLSSIESMIVELKALKNILLEVTPLLGKIVLKCNSPGGIKLGGDDASESMIMGDAFLDWVMNHTHLITTPAPSSPVSPPCYPTIPVPCTPAQAPLYKMQFLSGVVKVISMGKLPGVPSV